MLDDLVHYLTTERPPNLSLTSPDPSALCYYPLEIVVAEWVDFIEAMEYCVEGSECSAESRSAALKSNLRSLLSWRRRSRDMVRVARSTAEFIRLPNSNKSDALVAMANDYDDIAGELGRLGCRLEELTPTVVSLIQAKPASVA